MNSRNQSDTSPNTGSTTVVCMNPPDIAVIVKFAVLCRGACQIPHVTCAISWPIFTRLTHASKTRPYHYIHSPMYRPWPACFAAVQVGHDERLSRVCDTAFGMTLFLSACIVVVVLLKQKRGCTLYVAVGQQRARGTRAVDNVAGPCCCSGCCGSIPSAREDSKHFHYK